MSLDYDTWKKQQEEWERIKPQPSTGQVFNTHPVKRRRDWPDLEDRGSFMLVLGIIAVVAPLVIALGSVLVVLWMQLFNLTPDAHGLIFGWLSHSKPNGHGGYGYTPNAIPLDYLTVCLTIALTWLFGEGLWAAFKELRRALS